MLLYRLTSGSKVSSVPAPPHLVATTPLPAGTSALWRGGSSRRFFLGVVEKGLDRGPPEAGFPPAKLATGRLRFFDFWAFVQLSAI